MNGAITDPWLATNSAPNSAIVIISGASQNFLRTRKKAQNSPMKPRQNHRVYHHGKDGTYLQPESVKPRQASGRDKPKSHQSNAQSKDQQ